MSIDSNEPPKSWLYEEYKNRVCVELNEILFLPECDCFLFDTILMKMKSIEDQPIDLEDLKFSRTIDGVEEEYFPKKDEHALSGSPIYYPDDNCFTIYYNFDSARSKRSTYEVFREALHRSNE